MACIHKQYNKQLDVHYCDCLNKLYCNYEHCRFYQSTKRYKHGLEIESNGSRYFEVIDTKPHLNHKTTTKLVKTSCGMNYQRI